MIMKLVDANDALLYQECQAFDFENPQVDPHKLVEDLADTMAHSRGVGLSANQVGYNLKVFVMGNPDKPEDVFTVFNPKIVDYGEETMIAEEGCLSYPGLFVKVKRPASVRVRFSNAMGDTNTVSLSGFDARVFQHEYDHMMGISHINRASKFHLAQAKRQQKKLQKLRKRNEDKLWQTM
jgi:peptide deformylase